MSIINSYAKNDLLNLPVSLSWAFMNGDVDLTGFRQVGVSNIDFRNVLCSSYQARLGSEALLSWEADRTIMTYNRAQKLCPLIKEIFDVARGQGIEMFLHQPPSVEGIKQHPIVKSSQPLKLDVSFFKDHHSCKVCKHIYTTFEIQQKIESQQLDIVLSQDMDDDAIETIATSGPILFQSIDVLPTFNFVSLFNEHLDLVGFVYNPQLNYPSYISTILSENGRMLHTLYSSPNIIAMYQWYISNPNCLPLRNLSGFSLALGTVLSRSSESHQGCSKKIGKRLIRENIIMNRDDYKYTGESGPGVYFDYFCYLPRLCYTTVLEKYWASSPLVKSAKDCYRVIKNLMNSLLEGMTFVSDIIKKTALSLLRPLSDWVWEIFQLYIKDSLTYSIIKQTLGVATKVFFLILFGHLLGRGLFLIARKLFPSITDKQIKTLNPKYQSEGLELPTLSAMSFLVAVFGLSGSSLKSFREMCSTVTMAIGAGKAVMSVVSATLLLLPAAITAYLSKHNLMTDTNEIQRQFESWKVRAQGLISASSIASVASSEIFKTAIDTNMRESQILLKKLTIQAHRNVLLSLWNKVHSISLTLNQLESQTGDRATPYSLHISGPPGVGKSTFCPTFIMDVFGVQPGLTYSRPISSEYWDGFAGQRVIVLDEFLVGPPDIQSERAREYLALVSNQRFSPNLASVDNITVGIKGTLADPDVVISINNTNYDTAPYIDTVALQRRRNYVVECRLDPAFGGVGPVDLERLTDDQLRHIRWMQFRLLPNIRDEREVLWITYQDLVLMVKESYTAQRTLSDRLMANQGGNRTRGLDARQIIERITLNSIGVDFGQIEDVIPMEAEASVFRREPSHLRVTRERPKEEHHSRLNEDLYLISRANNDPNRVDMRKKMLSSLIRDNDRHQFRNGFWNVSFDPFYILSDDGVITPGPRARAAYNYEQTVDFIVHTHSCCGVEYSHNLVFERNKCEVCGRFDLCTSRKGYQMSKTTWDSSFSAMVTYYLEYQLDTMKYKNLSTFKPYHTHTCCDVEQFCQQHKTLGYHHCSLCHVKSPCSECEEMCAKSTIWQRILATPFKVELKPVTIFSHTNPLNLDVQEVREAELENVNIHLSQEEIMNFTGYDPEYEQPEIGFFEGLFSYKRTKVLGLTGICLLGGVLLATGFGLAYRSWSSLSGDTKNQDAHMFDVGSCLGFRPQSPSSDEYYEEDHKPKPHKQVRPFGGKKRNNNIQDSDSRGFESEKSAVYSLQVSVDGILVNIIPYRERLFISYYHGFKNCIDNESIIVFSTGAKDYTHTFRKENARVLPECDLICYNFTHLDFQSFPNNSGKFIPSSDIMQLSNISAMLHRNFSVEHTMAYLKKTITYNDGDSKYELANHFCYDAQTKKGDCGRPLVVSSTRLFGKIIGMHVAGTIDKEVGLGASTILTREIVEALSNFCEVMEAQGYQELSGPNLESVSQVRFFEVAPQPLKTKYKRSCLYGELGRIPESSPAILSRSDPRSQDRDPIEVSLSDTIAIQHVKLDDNIISQVKKELQESMTRKMKEKIPFRRLTFEEACAGVPGLLPSINTATSPGYPLMETRLKPGKKDSIWFDESGSFCYAPLFRRQVEEKLEEITNYRKGDKINHKFIGYLKDELVSPRKIDACLTRMIYCNDLIALTAFRMIYGTTIINIIRSEDLPPALGINAYSYDIDGVYDRLRLTGERFLDGDYKSWDKTINPQIITVAYEIFCSFNRGQTSTPDIDDYMFQHEVRSPCQVGIYLVLFVLTQVSGCFLTSLINCIVNDLNFRYAFKCLRPGLNYDKNVDSTILGDDHILVISDNVDVTPLELSDQLGRMGYTYTSAVKTEPLAKDWKPFDKCYFLGANLRLVDGRYSGALNKDTLYESIQWTKDKNASLHFTIKSFFECATQWDKEFFDKYTSQVNTALIKVGRSPVEVPLYYATRQEVAHRTASSRVRYTWTSQGGSQLTKLPIEQNVASTQQYNANRSSRNMSLALNESTYDLNTGLESLILRYEKEWKPSDAGELLSFDVPFDLISNGNQQNMQNMAFQRMMYFSSDVELTFLLNGNTFSQGCLVAYMLPLYQKSFTGSCFENYRMNSHVLLFPNLNTTAVLSIPFTYYKNAMNTVAGEFGLEVLCSVRICVLSPLLNPSPAPVTLSVFSSFKNPKFTIPRPIGVDPAAYNIFEAQGNTSSTEVTQYVVNTNSVVGTMPLENHLDSNATQSVGTDLGFSVPMDNPPLVSGSIPVHQVFSGLSKTVGVEPTVAMQFHPQAMFREPFQFSTRDDSLLESILGRTGILTRFKWTNGLAPGEVLFDVPLNSLFGKDYGLTGGFRNIASNVAILNLFDFWRADLEFEILAVKNTFQSGRLLATIGYGAPDITAVDRNVYINHLLDFSKDNMVCKWTVPYNASTEYLRTWSGSSYYDALRNCSMGKMKIFVNNQLQNSSEVVSDGVDLILSVRFRNVQVVEVKNNPIVDTRNAKIRDAPVFQAEGPENAITAEVIVDDVPEDTISVPVTTMKSRLQNASVCKLDLGRKFEYVIRDFHEVIRRPVPIFYDNVYFSTDSPTTASIIATIDVRPATHFCTYFRVWSGHIKYRIFCNTTQITKVMYVNDNPTSDYPGMEATLFARAGIPYIRDGKVYSASQSAVPVEILYNVALTQKFIDISVPFNTHYNFLLNGVSYAGYDGYGPYRFCGKIAIVFNSPDPLETYKRDVVYSSMGDDGRVMLPIFIEGRVQPPPTTLLEGYGAYFP